MKKDIKTIADYFLFLLLAISFIGVAIVLRSFVSVIFMAAIFSSLFYPLYGKLYKWTKGSENIAAFLSVLIFLLVIVIPLVNFAVLVANESASTYGQMQTRLGNGQLEASLAQLFSKADYLQKTYLGFINMTGFDLRQVVLDVGASMNRFIVTAAASLISGTTHAVVNLALMLLAMFFFFRDGHLLMQRISFLTPLSNKYDQKLYDKFREVTRATILSSLLIALTQGILAAIGYAIIGLPAFFLGVITCFAAIIPIVGTSFIAIPVLVYLAITGQWTAFIFSLIWSFLFVSLVDNAIRSWVIKGQTGIHPLLVFFSVLGGIEAFGAQGILFGPLILAITLTLLHIYELEYEHLLER